MVGQLICYNRSDPPQGPSVPIPSRDSESERVQSGGLIGSLTAGWHAPQIERRPACRAHSDLGDINDACASWCSFSHRSLKCVQSLTRDPRLAP
jgi:hypothetical protein